jgi:dihydroorotate dehydrogenase electron transfer subunit
MISLPHCLDPLLPRPFAAFDWDDGQLEILYRRVGKGTSLLSHVRIGSILQVLGPLGRGYRLQETQGSPALVFAGGIGFASVHFLLKQRLLNGQAATLLYGTRASSELYPLETSLPEHPLLKVHLATEDGAKGFRGNVHDLFLDLRAREPGFTGSYRVAFGCGPVPMMRVFSRTLQSEGVPAEISLETHMACGYGVCQGCVIQTQRSPEKYATRYRKVCVDGPVFSHDEVDWETIR